MLQEAPGHIVWRSFSRGGKNAQPDWMDAPPLDLSSWRSRGAPTPAFGTHPSIGAWSLGTVCLGWINNLTFNNFLTLENRRKLTPESFNRIAHRGIYTMELIQNPTGTSFEANKIIEGQIFGVYMGKTLKSRLADFNHHVDFVRLPRNDLIE